MKKRVGPILLLFLSIVQFVRGDKGEPEVIGFPQPIKAAVGSDVILPCHLEPPFDMSTLTVEWSLNDSKVHVYRHGEDDPTNQEERFKGRTSLFHEEMVKGNISLKLSRVEALDAGHYRCFVPKLHSQVRKGYIDLTVGRTKVIRSQLKEAVVGENVILPCHTETPKDVRSLTVEWTIDSISKLVHLYTNGRDDLDGQLERYKDRTSLFHDQLSKGNLSLKLLRVQLSDETNYTCSVVKLVTEEMVTRRYVYLTVSDSPGGQGNVIGPKDDPGDDKDNSHGNGGGDRHHFSIVAAVLVVIAIVIFIAIIFSVVKHNRRKGQQAGGGGDGVNGDDRQPESYELAEGVRDRPEEEATENMKMMENPSEQN